MPTHRENFLRKHKLPLDTHLSVKEIAKLSGVPYKALMEVKKRGLGAHRTNPESVRVKGTFKKDPKVPISRKLSAEQWGLARIYSFVDKGKTYHTADADIAERYKV